MSSAFSYQATPSHTSTNGPAEQVLHFLPPLQRKGGETTESPQKSSTPLPRHIICPPKAPVSVKRATRKRAIRDCTGGDQDQAFGARRGWRGEDGRITSGKWDTRQRQTGYVVDYSYQYKNKWKGGNREHNGEAMSVVTLANLGQIVPDRWISLYKDQLQVLLSFCATLRSLKSIQRSSKVHSRVFILWKAGR